MSEALQAIEGGGPKERGPLRALIPRIRAVERCLRLLPRRVKGRIVSADAHGVVVDLGGAQGFAPRQELGLDWMLAGAELGQRFSGYVTGVEDTAVLLSRFGRRQRRRRDRRREAALASLTTGLEQPGERQVVRGLVLSTGEQGALVALEDGLITGLVPALALQSRPHVAVGRTLEFRVIGRPRDRSRNIDVLLWPQPT
jgi:ribosomal protein S1